MPPRSDRRKEIGSDLALPSPRRADALAALALVALVVFAFWEIAFLGRTLTSSFDVEGVSGEHPSPGHPPADTRDVFRVDRGAAAWGFEPWAAVTHRIAARGDLPLWSPYQGAGTPLAANMQSAVFDPLMVGVHLHPVPWMWDLTFLLWFVGGALATYAFGRLVGLGMVASFTGAGAYVLSGYFFIYSNDQFFRIYFYVPVLLAMVEVVVRSRSALPVAGLGLAIAGCLLAGMPEASFFVLAATGAFGVYRSVRGPRMAGSIRTLGRLGAGAGLGFGLAAPLLLPFAEYLPLSFHVHDPGVGMGADLPRWWLNWMVLFVNGPPVMARTGGGFSGTREWVGLAVPALGVVALGSPAAMRRHRGWFLACCGIVVLMKQYGIPPVQQVGKLPLANQANFMVFAIPIAAFCLAMLAAVGVQAVGDRAVRLRPFVLAAAAFVVLLVTALAANRNVLSGDPAYVWQQLGIAGGAALVVAVGLLPLPHPVKLSCGAAVAVGGWLLLAPGTPYRSVALLGAAAVMLAVLVLRRPRNAGALVVSAAVIAELLVYVPRHIYPRRWDPYLPPSWMQVLERGGAAVGPERVFGMQGRLFPNTAGVFGFKDIRSLDALYVKRYVDYVRTFVEPEVHDRFNGSPPDQTTRPNMDSNPMWDLLGVRYLVTGPSDGVSPFLNRAFAAVAPANDLRPGIVELGGDRRQSVLMQGTQQLVYPVYERTPGAVSFLYEAAGPPGAGAALSVEAVTPGGRVPVWQADVGVGAGAPAGWQRGQADLGKVAGPISALLLRSETSDPAVDGFWADLQIHDPDRPHPPEGVNRLRPRPTEGPALVFEDVGTLPRAFVVHRARPVAGPAEAVAELHRGGSRFADGAVRVGAFDPSTEAIVEAAPGDLAGLAEPAGPRPDEPRSATRITSYAPNRVEMTTRTDAPALLVLTDVFYPGWQVTVNGRKAKVLATDLAFRGVRVGEGFSRVVFAYRPASFRLGLAIAALTVVVTAGALARSSGLRRRAGGPRAE